MARLKVRCISTKAYLKEMPDGSFLQGQLEGDLISLTLNKIYDALEEDDEDYRVIDNTNEDYLYPKMMFEVVGA
ncbi:MAG: hypothetical protein ACI8UP_002978 [Porticoccaceae bacterium]|jgi:hypothetical protein